MSDDLKESLNDQKVIEKPSLFDLNVQQWDSFQKTKTHEQLKYSNPLRDYSHILSGRLLNALIVTEEERKGKKLKKKQVVKLRKDVV